MRWGREELKQREKQQVHQQLEKKHPEKQNHQQRQQLPQQQQQNQKHREQLLHPPQQQQQEQYRNREQLLHPPLPPQSHHQRQQDKEGRSSSSSSTPFSLFAPSSWISKLKHTLHSSKNSTKAQVDPIPKRNQHHHHLNSPDPRIKPDAQRASDHHHHHRRKLDKSAGGPRPTTVASPPPAGSKAHQVQPLSPIHPARISSVSDHYISFLPADLDDGVFLPARRSYERMPPGGGVNGLYEAGERAAVAERRRGMSFDPFGSSSHSHADAAATAVPALRRSESAKLTRIASDLTTASTTRSSPQPRPERKGTGTRSRREEFLLFSFIPDTIRRINTTPAASQSTMRSTATAPEAPRGSTRPASDSARQVHDPRRKSFSSSGTGHKLRRKSKVRVHSPRVGAGVTKKKAPTVAEVAAEKLLPRKTTTVGQTTTTATSAPGPHHPQLESFAVVKCSSDPRRDFRDSMLEMISELDMARPDELEGLLACYLSLNADEYHDVIVRVFRQVWLDLILDSAAASTSPTHTHQRASA